MNKLLISVGVFVSILMSVAVVSAQSCRGSHLTYIVRDSKGKALDAAAGAFTFEGGESRASQRWHVATEAVGRGLAKLPADVNQKDGHHRGLSTSEMCNFRAPVTLTIVLGKKRMDLTFNLPPLGSQESADFLVDSVPFKAGRYEIALARPERWAEYYAPSGWKKLR